MAWSTDLGPEASLPQVQAAAGWHAFDGAKSWGFGAEPVWIRIRLRAAMPGETEPWIVRVRPAYLDFLSLEDPAAQLHRRSGHLMSSRSDALDSVPLTLQVPALPLERDVYLRIQTRTSRIAMVDVLPLRQAQEESRFERWMLGFMVSLSILFALWALAQWALHRDQVMGAFAVKQWMATLWALTNLGYVRALVDSDMPPVALNLAENSIRSWTVCATVWFLTVLIREYHPPRRSLIACHVVVAFTLAVPLLQFAGLTSLVLAASNVAIMLGFALLCIALALAPRSDQQPIPRRVMLCYLLLYLLLAALPVPARLGLTPVSAFHLSSSLSHLVLDGLVMFLLLQLRARNLAVQARRAAEQHQSMVLELDRAQRGIEFEQRRRDEQSQFMHMLMHELKTPLSVISLALGNRDHRKENLAHASQAVQDMKMIIERCVQADQFGQQPLRLQSENIDLPALVKEVASQYPRLASRWHLHCDGAVPGLRTDPQLLCVILGNLFDNAARYGDASAAVRVSLQEEARDGRLGLCLRISNAPGLVGRPDPARVFEKYYRSSGAQRESGSGLGLHLSRQLARSLGGSLEFQPASQLVEFVLWIPLNPA